MYLVAAGALAALGNELLATDDKKRKVKNTVANIKKYIDDNFSDPELSLERISVDLFYNKSYVSHIFKRKMGESPTEHITKCR